MWIFFTRKKKNWKIWNFWGEIFQITQTQPEPSNKKLIWPNLGQKILTLIHDKPYKSDKIKTKDEIDLELL